MKNRHLGFEGGMKVVTNKKKMFKDLPISKKWHKSMKSLTSDKKDFDKKNIEYYYACSFSVPTNQEELGQYIQDAEYAVELPFEERLSFELSRLNIYAYVKHRTLILGERINNIRIPDGVLAIVKELVKVKMMVEYEVYGNDEIKKTIPSLDTTKVDPKVVENEITALKQQIEDEEPLLDMDIILDKIGKYGISSISKQEMDFLNEQSKKI